jgi:hypothetical protein
MRCAKHLVAVAALAAVALGSGAAAHAVPLKFTLSGDQDFSWNMDSDPLPINSTAGSELFQLTGVPDFDFLQFRSDILGGGLTASTNSHAIPFDFNGPKIYSGVEGAPHFSIGSFVLTFNNLTNAAANETLQISALATTPIPAALPLFASALGGLGFAGYRRKRTLPTA